MSSSPWIVTIFTCAAFMTCCGDLDSDQRFEGCNKCGCYRLNKCPSVVQCSSAEQNHLEELYEYSSLASSPKKCSTFAKKITDSENGTLKMAIQFSSDYKGEIHYEAQLVYVDPENGMAVHSKLYLVMHEDYDNGPCKKVLEFSFPYVFSGSYRLEIKHNDLTRCISQDFNVTTAYRKELIINEKESSITGQRSMQEAPFETRCVQRPSKTSTNLECTFSDKRMSQVKSIHVRVTDETNKDFMVTHLHGNSGSCCDFKGNLSNCPCKWSGNRTLICTVQDLKPGNYIVILEYIDPRCEIGTLWTETGNYCLWSLNEVVSQNENGNESHPTTERPTIPPAYAAVFIIIVPFGFILFIFKNKNEVRNRFQVFDGEISETTSSLELIPQEHSNLLLLYPRDCEAFMRAMRQFRMILNDSLLGKVYDPWDDDIFEEVAVSSITWSVPYIADDKVIIVIVLSQCSKIMEEAYILNKYNLTYRNPKAFDTIFGQSLNAIYHHFVTRSDCYQRLFVVRLDEPADMKLSFHLNCPTIYTIPQGLQILLEDLSKNHPTISEEYLCRLETSIKEYRNLKEHYDYLNDILKIT